MEKTGLDIYSRSSDITRVDVIPHLLCCKFKLQAGR